MKEILQNRFLKKRSLEENGTLLFLSGIFFLPSTLFIGILFLLPASIIGSFLQKKPYLKDQWNFSFLTFGVLILISAFLQNFLLINKYESIWDPQLSIVGMGNWLPFIWIFWALQPYLNSSSKRRSFSLCLIAGSFPVLITGLCQFFLNWTGPFETLNGLIIWYQRPIENPGGLSGLFNNQNYAGSWFNFVWPFCLALLLEKSKNILKKTIAFGFFFSVGLSGFLTFSRNAWLGLLVALPAVLGKKSFRIVIPILLISLLIFSPYLTGEIQNNFRGILPEKILLEFTEEGYKGLDTSRIEIFSSAINLISLNPIFGIGAGSFTPIFLSETNFWKGHSHNLFLELSISYGLPSTLIFFFTIFIILILSGSKIYRANNDYPISFFDRAFWGALLYFMISQLFDIQYFDGRISMIAWILLASLKNIIEENHKKV